MSSRTLVSIAALGALTVLAFGSAGGESNFSFDGLDDLKGIGASGGGGASAAANVAACKAHVEHFNSLECLPESARHKDSYCENYNNSFVDYAAFFACMTENAKCNGNIPDLAGLSQCADLARP